MGIRSKAKVNEVSTSLSDMKVTIAGRPKVGKAIDNKTKIPTPHGWKYAEDIKLGDKLFDRKGLETTVLGVYPQGILKSYEVFLQDGTSFIVNDEHIVPYVTSRKNIANKTLKEMMVDYKTTVNKFGRDVVNHKYRIPKNKGVAYSEKQYDINPYAIGALIGDGCLTLKYLQISNNEIDVVEKIAESLYFNMPKRNSKFNYNWMFTTTSLENRKELKKKLEFLGLNVKSIDRFIPEKYLQGSIEQRKELLRGLMDTDGTVSINKQGSMKYVHTTNSEQLHKDVKELSLSLGYGTTVSSYDRDDEGNTEFVVRIYTDDVIVSSEKHLSKLSEYELKSFKDEYTYIVDIVEVEPREMVCFKVDNEEELFLINDYIVTHNTSLFYEILKREGGLDTGLLMAFEKGYGFLPDINVVDIETWQEFIEYVDDLVDDAEGFKFLGLDTVDIAGKLCQEYVLKKQSAKDGKRYEALADMPFGKAYELLENEFSKQIGRLEQAGFGLFFITHDKDRQVEEKNGMRYDKVQMSVSGRVGDYIKNSSDFIIFIDIEKEKVKDGKTQKVQESRKMRFRGDGTTEAGGRVREVPEVIDYDVDDFLKTIESAIVTQTEKMKTKGTSSKKVDTKKEKTKKVEDKKEDTSDSLDEIKSKMSDFVTGLETKEKKEWAKRFKEELGTMNFNDSEDLDALKSLLSEME